MNSELLLYQTEDGRLKIQVRLENETVWLTQADMVELFQTTWILQKSMPCNTNQCT